MCLIVLLFTASGLLVTPLTERPKNLMKLKQQFGLTPGSRAKHGKDPDEASAAEKLLTDPLPVDGSSFNVPKAILTTDCGIQTDVSSFTIASDASKFDRAIKKLAIGILHVFGAYIILLGCVLCSSTLQSMLLYLHVANYPSGDLTNLSLFNLHSTRNIHCITSDGIRLRGYHTIPTNQYQSIITANSINAKVNNNLDMYFDESIATTNRIILYLHGNAGNRAVVDRVNTIHKLANMFDAHVIEFDYRGFGDNSGVPNEVNTKVDSIAMFDWIRNKTVSKAVKTETTYFYLYGHSLGTAIATQLASHIENTYGNSFDGLSKCIATATITEKESCSASSTAIVFKGLLLDSPFTSVPEVAVESPSAKMFPFFTSLGFVLKKLVRHQYQMKEILPTLTKTNIYIIHGTADTVIPFSHTNRLYDGLVSTSVGNNTNPSKVTDWNRNIVQSFYRQSHSQQQFVMSVVINGGHHDLMFQQELWDKTLLSFISTIELER